MIDIDLLFNNVKEVSFNRTKKNIKFDFSKKNIYLYDVINFYGKLLYIINKKITVNKIIIVYAIDTLVDSSVIILISIGLIYFHKIRPDITIVYKENQKESINIRKNILINSPLFDLFTKKINIDELTNIIISNKVNKFAKCNYFIKNIDCNNIKSISIVVSELKLFIKSFFDDIEFINNIKNVCSELISNALEHSKKDCLLFISIFDIYETATMKKYKLIDISIICPCEKNIYSDLREMFYNHKIKNNNIYDAYNYHSNFFNDEYTENMFFIISAMQPNITSRENQNNGGTGLPIFINNIKNKIKEQWTYLVANNEALFFYNDYININNEEIGFNDSSNYINDLPHKKCAQHLNYSINGLLYNIVMIKEDNE